MSSDYQKLCDDLSRVVLTRRSYQPDPKPQLYLCKVKQLIKDKDVAWLFLSHDFNITRITICGGNAGLGCPDTFRGISSGCQLPFRCEKFVSVEAINLDDIEIPSLDDTVAEVVL